MRCASLLFIYTLLSASSSVTSGDERITSSIQRGVRFLKETQDQKKGNWQGVAVYRGGVTALCTLAMLESGAANNDPAVKQALEYLVSLNEPKQTYTAALQTMAFCKASEKAYSDLITRNVSILESLQFAEGETQGGWSYAKKTKATIHADPSNSRFALLALDAAKQAGFEVKARTWSLALKYWLRSQNDDGSWSYQRGPRHGTGSMTCAGISSLAIAGKHANGDASQDVKSRNERARQWMAREFAVTKNPGEDRSRWLFYYLDTLAQAGRRSGESRFGEHDWFNEGAGVLVNRQSLNGSWAGEIRGQPQIATSFALMFLSAKADGQLKTNRLRIEESGR